MAESIDFKYPMKRACAWEIATFCKDAAHGHGRVVRCLQQRLDHEDMSRWDGGSAGASGGASCYERV